MKKKIFSGFLSKMAIVIPVFFAVIFSSCYYDYGLDSDTNYDMVVTLYNNNYDFATVQNYYLDPTVRSLDGGNTSSYGSTIISTLTSNLNELGWNQITDSATARSTPNTVFVGSGEFTTTTTEVSCGYGYGGYYGWYYPDYYCGYSYTYTTGTVAILMADLSLPLTDGKTAIQWSGTLNGLTNSSGGSTGGTPQQRITKGINQAFEQSPYLK